MVERLQEAPIRNHMYRKGGNGRAIMDDLWRKFYRDLRSVKSDRDPDASEGDFAVFDQYGNPVAGSIPDVGAYIYDLLESSTGITISIDTDTGTITITASLDDFDTDNLAEGSENLYYTSDRVNDQVETFIIEGQNIDISRVLDELTVATLGVKYSRTLQKDDDYVITVADILAYESIRMYAATNKIFTFPSVGASEDGLRARIFNAGNARLTIQMPDSDKIGDSAATGTIYTDDSFAALEVEYCHANETWFILGQDGTWTEYPASEHIHLEDLAGDILLEDGSYASLE